MAHKQGDCPVCNGHELDYGALNPVGMSIGYPWTCKKCKSTGTEWYTVTFDTHTINEDKTKQHGNN
jgi:hypothetical protein